MALSRTQKMEAGKAFAEVAVSGMDPAMAASFPPISNANASNFSNALFQFPARASSFFGTLFERLAYQRILNAEARNRLADKKRGTLTAGGVASEIVVNLGEVRQWDRNEDYVGEVLKTHKPQNIHPFYYETNFEYQTIPMSISPEKEKFAFTDWAELYDIATRRMDAMYAGMENKEYLQSVDLIRTAYENGYLKCVKINDFATATQDEINENYTTTREIALNMETQSTDYNFAGLYNLCDIENQEICVLNKVRARSSVNLAYAFHKEDADFLGNVISLPNFNGAEKNGLQMVAYDRRNWFFIMDNFRRLTYDYNYLALTWNYAYTVSAIYNFTTYTNAVAYCTELKTITDVTVPAGKSVRKGDSILMTASVATSGNGGYWAACDYSIKGNASNNTYITPYGLLVVDPKETASTITVTAKSRQDGTKTGTATVTVTA
jgi:hypothetical protein